LHFHSTNLKRKHTTDKVHTYTLLTMFTSQDTGFFNPGQNVGGSSFGGAAGGFHNEAGSNVQNRQGGGDFGGQQRRKNRVFAPVTLKMIQEA